MVSRPAKAKPRKKRQAKAPRPWIWMLLEKRGLRPFRSKRYRSRPIDTVRVDHPCLADPRGREGESRTDRR